MSERARGHIAGSVHVPLHELPGRLHQLPREPLWVHCQGGYRASIAASLLQAAGHTVTAVDGDFGRATFPPRRASCLISQNRPRFPPSDR